MKQMSSCCFAVSIPSPPKEQTRNVYVLFVALSSERQDFHTLADVSGRSTGRAVDEAPRAGERGEHRTVLDRLRERAAVAQLGPQIIRSRAVGGQVFAPGRGSGSGTRTGGPMPPGLTTSG